MSALRISMSLAPYTLLFGHIYLVLCFGWWWALLYLARVQSNLYARTALMSFLFHVGKTLEWMQHEVDVRARKSNQLLY